MISKPPPPEDSLLLTQERGPYRRAVRSSIEIRPILFIIGLLLTVIGASMLIPAAVDLATHSENWKSFAVGAVLTGFVGLSLSLVSAGELPDLGRREAVVLTVLSWVIICIFAAVPLSLGSLQLSYTDAFFEAMSGLTTTGATVLTGLDQMPQGVLIWRSLLQWLGGIGIIVMAIALLPFLRIGGMQLFRLESSEKSEKILPRPKQIATSIGAAYLLLTLVGAIAYAAAGMTGFEAINHAMTSIATAGFSTSDRSIGNFSEAAQWVAVALMIAGAMPFVIYVRMGQGRSDALRKNSQLRAFLLVLFVLIVMLTWQRHISEGIPFGEALRETAVNLTAVMTTTGYAASDYSLWGEFSIMVLLFAGMIGGCTGSTTGGIKLFRFQILKTLVQVQVRRFIHLHGVFIARYEGKELSQDVSDSVAVFLILFVTTIAGVAIALGLFGLDMITALSGAISVVTNLGPGLGEEIGPAGNFGGLPDGAKWVLTAGMLVGRLELLTVFALLSRLFWRR